MPNRKQTRWLFLGDLEDHSVRQSFCGAAEYAAARPAVDFDLWSEYPGRTAGPTFAELKQADGLLVAEIDLPFVSGAQTLNRPYVAYFAQVSPARYPAIFADTTATGRIAAEHLIQRGYRNLAFFGMPDTPWSDARREGFRAAAAAQGLSIRNYEVLPTGIQVYRPPQFESIHHALQSALANLPTPCGIFAACDIGACYVIRTARKLGFRIPDQLGVIGVDDNPLANSAAGLPISTIDLPFREAGWRAAAMLDQWIRTGKRPPNPPPLLPVRVIVRTSTNQFMVADPLLRRAQELIEARRAEGMTVDEAVRLLRTTKVALGRRFREHLKLTPAKYILQRRLEYAKELLRAGELSVAQVSDACHFHDCSYFSKIFKQATGSTPSALQPKR